MTVNQVIQIHEDEGIRTGLLVGAGPKFIRVIWPDSAGIKIRKILKCRALRYQVLDSYSINKAKRSIRRMGKVFGITKSARRALQGAA